MYPSLDQINVYSNRVFPHALNKLRDILLKVLDGTVLDPDGQGLIFLCRGEVAERAAYGGTEVRVLLSGAWREVSAERWVSVLVKVGD